MEQAIEIVNREVQHLVEKYDATVLLQAFITKEVVFRLEQIHNLDVQSQNNIKNDIITYFSNHTHDIFDYDTVDNIIQRYIEKRDEICKLP